LWNEWTGLGHVTEMRQYCNLLVD